MEITSTSTQLPDFLKALAHELRWKILVFLAHSDHSVAEIVHFLGQPQNVVSYHLRKLREHRVVTERRSSADSRDVYYSLRQLGRCCIRLCILKTFCKSGRNGIFQRLLFVSCFSARKIAHAHKWPKGFYVT